MNDGAAEEWLDLLAQVMCEGSTVSPRGFQTLEIINATAAIDMYWPVILSNDRGLNYRFMAAEAFWIMSGDNSTQGIVPYLKAIEKFSDNGLTYFGAYGPKIIEQMPYVLECLTSDPDSRQAVINIWRERPPASKDIPCTLSLQFLIRNSKVHVVAHMRSSDLWLGFPYDVFNFSMLGHYVAAELGLKVHTLHWSAASCHLYERNFIGANQLLEKGAQSGPIHNAPLTNGADVLALVKLARDVENMRPDRWTNE